MIIISCFHYVKNIEHSDYILNNDSIIYTTWFQIFIQFIREFNRLHVHKHPEPPAKQHKSVLAEAMAALDSQTAQLSSSTCSFLYEFLQNNVCKYAARFDWMIFCMLWCTICLWKTFTWSGQHQCVCIYAHACLNYLTDGQCLNVHIQKVVVVFEYLVFSW